MRTMGPPGRLIAVSRRRAVTLVVVALGVLAAPGPASAHVRTGTVAVDYRASVLMPETAAYVAQINQSDHGLTLTRRPGHAVELLGYLGEPVFRLDSAGLWVNVASPTADVLGLLSKAQRSDAATPQWRLKRGRNSVVWRDARTQTLPPGINRGTWSVPLLVDGRRTPLRGELHRYPAPRLWLWLVVLGILLAGGVSPLLLRRRARIGTAASSLALVSSGASAVIAVSFTLDPYASPGTWILCLDELVFLVAGVGVLLRGPRHLHLVAAIGVGLVGFAVGLVNGAIFLHPVVLALLPGTVMRILAVIATAAGVSAAVLGCLFYLESAAAKGDPEARDQLQTALAELPEYRLARGYPSGARSRD
jgi:hypothetical protein